jgi:hypothetical protein
MTLPTRQLVQSPVVNPNLSGPAFTMDFTRDSSPRVSRGLRPARPALLRPARPDSFRVRAQRLTDCRCTPTWRDTSASLSPFLRSVAAFSRRSSNASKSRLTPAGLPMHESVAEKTGNVTIFCDSQ